MPHHPDTTESLQAHPNITAASEMLAVSASTLSRRSDLAAERRGERDIVLPPREVLRLAAIYRKRSLNDVAQALIEHAGLAGTEEQRRVEGEIEDFFGPHVDIVDEHEQLLTLARRLLPADLCEQIEAVTKERGAELPDAIQGYPPIPEP
jgi:hypothetical protein